MNFKEFVEAYRHYFLIAELMGVFHDIGKMSTKFIYAKDQEKNSSHIARELFEEEFITKTNEFIRSILSSRPSIEDIIHPDKFMEIIMNHHSQELDNLSKHNYIADVLFLPGADGMDSGFDKGFVSHKGAQRVSEDENKGSSNLYAITFGGFKIPLDYKEFDKKRIELQKEIIKIIDSDKSLEEKQENIIKTYRKYTKEALAETRIPANDVRLSDHCYSVGSLAKSLMLKLLWDFVNKEKKPNNLIEWYLFKSKARWQILFVEWNFDRYVSNLRRIDDLLGRQYLLGRFKERLESVISYKYQLGNRLYDDERCIAFLMPGFDKDFIKENAGFLFEHIKDMFPEELKPESALKVYSLKSPTSNLLKIASFFGKNKAKDFELLKSISFYKETDDTIRSGISSDWRQNLCIVCKSNITTHTDESDEAVCKNCKRIREKANALEESRKYSKKNINHIDDKILCAVVIKLPVEKWISGELLRTLLINESNPQEKETMINDLENDFKEFKNVIKDKNIRYLEEYWQKRDEIKIIVSGGVKKKIPKNTVIEESRIERNLKNKLKELKEHFDDQQDIDFYPSDIIAHMLEELFITDLSEIENVNFDYIVNKFYEKYPSPSRIRRILKECEEFLDEVSLIPEEEGKNHRILLKSPKELSILVPADYVLSYAKTILDKHKERFSYLIGRFPIYLFGMFFRVKYPLYTVLEAVKNIDYLEFGEKEVLLKNKEIRFEESVISLKEFDRENGKESNKKNEYLKKLFINFLNKDNKLINYQTEKEETVKFYPSLFDFIILDSPDRRFETLMYKDNIPFEKYDDYFKANTKSFFIENKDFENMLKIMKVFDQVNSSSLYKVMDILEKNYLSWKTPQANEESNTPPHWREFAEDTFDMFLGDYIKDSEIKKAMLNFACDLRIFKIFNLWKYLR
ncbi:MAG TPA: hypothetical protein ENO33_03725 [Hydrogenobaculum sp.]|nr:hypothetical protein [Hydrogenobaculum sp.]